MAGIYWLAGGTLFVIIGLVLSTICASFLTSTTSPLTRRESLTGFFAFAVVTTLGGLATTHGWELRSAERQREAILRSLAAETAVNRFLLTLPSYTETDPERLQQFVHFPSLQRNVLTDFISSGLFPPEDFFELRLAAMHLHLQLHFLDTVLISVRDQMSRGTPSSRAVLRSNVAASSQLNAVREAMNDLARDIDRLGTLSPAVSLTQVVASEWEFTVNPDGSVTLELTRENGDESVPEARSLFR